MLQLLDTPSSGVDETLAALADLHATFGRTVDINHISRVFGVGVAVLDIEEVLSSLEASHFVTQDDNGNYSLTQAGVIYHRQNKPRRSRLDLDVDDAVDAS